MAECSFLHLGGLDDIKSSRPEGPVFLPGAHICLKDGWWVRKKEFPKAITPREVFSFQMSNYFASSLTEYVSNLGLEEVLEHYSVSFWLTLSSSVPGKRLLLSA